MSDSTSNTGSALFALLECPEDQRAWSTFVDRYGPKIFVWCRAYGLQQADAEDITQQVLTKFIQKANSFQYDSSGSFRAWLKTITRHAVADLFKDFARLRGSGDEQLLERLQEAAAVQHLEESLDEAFERELLERAMQLVQLRVEPKTWQAFELTTLWGSSGAEVADKLKLSVAAVYMAKCRVQKMLTAQIQQMDVGS